MDEFRNDQQEAFEFLSDPASHSGYQVSRIDTHANVLFLAGQNAFKVKREVRLPFLDYSTLAKRKAACLAELEVNRTLAPGLYRRVVPITREPSGRLALGGQGEPIEWAVEMRRFDDSATLDRVAEADGISHELAEQLAAMVATMHARSTIASTRIWLATLERILDQNTLAFRDVPDLFAEDAVAKLDREARQAFERLRRLLTGRGRMEFVRRCHGDLHLGNIVLIEGHPVPFDAIEFDPVIASGDVLYDLAFLLMDLVHRGLDEAANVVLNGYLEHTQRLENLDGLAALPLFLSVRAAIRAKVAAARLLYAEAKDQPATIEMGRSYFSLAVRLLSPPKAKLVAIGGLSGTGKSSVARTLAASVWPAPGAIVVRSDVERKRVFGKQPTERLAPEGYRPEITAKVYDILSRRAARIVAGGHSVIVDAVFARPEERASIAEVARAAGVEFSGVFLVADLQVRLDRLGARMHDASDADAVIARQQERYSLGLIDWLRVDAGDSPRETLERVRASLV